MFPLRDRTRRQLAILAFVALCLVPTAIVLACGLAWHLPGQKQKEAARLSALLGLRATLDNVEYPRPGVVRYVGLELSDVELGKTVLSCRQLEAHWETIVDKQGQSHSCLMVALDKPQLDAAGFLQVWRLIQEVLTCRADRAEVDVRLGSPQLLVRSGTSQQILADFRGSLTGRSEGAQADVSFRPASAEKTEMVRLRVVRNRQTQPPTTGMAFETSATPLPCSLLAAIFPSLDPLGTSRFAGYVWANETPYGWDGGLTGRFSDVDLERLLAGCFPHAIRGTAQISIDEARIQRGCLLQLAGSIAGAEGELSRPLLDAAIEHLGLSTCHPIPGAEPSVPYRQLGLAFSLDARGVSLTGQCRDGSLVVDGYGPFLTQPPLQPLPVAALVRTFVPTNDHQVPATRESDSLLRWLPLPSRDTTVAE